MIVPKLNVGDVCRLNETIPGIYKSGDWKTGLYRVTAVRPGIGYGPITAHLKTDPRFLVYSFEKIKKDGTPYKHFRNGYRCQTWDGWIDSGRVTVVSVNTEQPTA